jgi:hypothetical protein
MTPPATNNTAMSFDLWDHQFCLACDKQVHTDGEAYCSESCRLADFEKTSSSSPSSQASSPSFSPSSYPWGSASPRQSPTKFYLSPAYDFSNAQPYGSSVAPQHSYLNNYSLSRPAPRPVQNLTPSSSQSSLCSMQSSSSSSESNQLSDKARKELRAYAVSFENVRTQRRRSY